MYIKTESDKLKADISNALRQWSEDKIESLCANYPHLLPMSVYLRRGVTNYLSHIDSQIDSAVDMLLLFVADDEGVINTDTLINDAVEMFKLSDIHETNIGIFNLTYGAGEILLSLPRNPILDIFIGNLGQIKLTAEDLLEMKNYLKA